MLRCVWSPRRSDVAAFFSCRCRPCVGALVAPPASQVFLRNPQSAYVPGRSAVWRVSATVRAYALLRWFGRNGRTPSRAGSMPRYRMEITTMGWTEERVETLKKLWAEGLSASQIAGRLGQVTRNAVIGKVHRLGLSGRATTSRMKSHRPRPRAAVAKRLAKPRFRHGRQHGAARASIRPTPSLTCRRWRSWSFRSAERRSIETLAECDCRWPIGDPQEAEFHFCGKKKVAGLPYCEFHARRAFQPPQARRRARDRGAGRRAGAARHQGGGARLIALQSSALPRAVAVARQRGEGTGSVGGLLPVLLFFVALGVCCHGRSDATRAGRTSMAKEQCKTPASAVRLRSRCIRSCPRRIDEAALGSGGFPYEEKLKRKDYEEQLSPCRSSSPSCMRRCCRAQRAPGGAVRGARRRRQGRHDQALRGAPQSAPRPRRGTAQADRDRGAASGTSSATPRSCRRPARSCCSTAPGTIAPASSA